MLVAGTILAPGKRTVCAALRAIQTAAAKGTEPSELKVYVENLKRSKGELPPKIWPARTNN